MTCCCPAGCQCKSPYEGGRSRLHFGMRHAPPAEARRLAAEVEARRAEIQRGLAADGPKLAALVAATAASKARSEAGVAALFPGRTVNVMGEINNVLSAA